MIMIMGSVEVVLTCPGRKSSQHLIITLAHSSDPACCSRTKANRDDGRRLDAMMASSLNMLESDEKEVREEVG